MPCKLPTDRSVKNSYLSLYSQCLGFNDLHLVISTYGFNKAIVSCLLFSEIVLHPDYEFTPQADRYDVALLKLDRPATLMPHISPVCLPDPEPELVGTRSIVAGWGAMDPDSVRRPKVVAGYRCIAAQNMPVFLWYIYLYPSSASHFFLNYRIEFNS